MTRSAPTLNVKLPELLSFGLAPALSVKFWIAIAFPDPVSEPAVKLMITAQFAAADVALAVNLPAAVVPERKKPEGAVRPPLVLSVTVPPPATTPIVPKLIAVFSVRVMAWVQAASPGAASRA